MEIAVLSESAVDDVAVRILVEAMIEKPIEWQGIPWLKTRGWPSILDILPKAIQYFHYKTDVRGIVIVADSDRSPLHCPETVEPFVCDEKCRLCRLRKAA